MVCQFFIVLKIVIFVQFFCVCLLDSEFRSSLFEKLDFSFLSFLLISCILLLIQILIL